MSTILKKIEYYEYSMSTILKKNEYFEYSMSTVLSTVSYSLLTTFSVQMYGILSYIVIS